MLPEYGLGLWLLGFGHSFAIPHSDFIIFLISLSAD